MWLKIKDFENSYEVSDRGEVRSLDRVIIMKNGYTKTVYGRIMRQKDNGKGYMAIALWKEGKMYHKYVHRLVAEAFIPNPDNLPQVNHKNENRADNRVENLEWCDVQYNINYGTGWEKRFSTLRKQGKKVGEDSHQRKVEYMRMYNSTEERRRRRKEYEKENREILNRKMREYRKKKKGRRKTAPLIIVNNP